jgi:hypothetical protein
VEEKTFSVRPMHSEQIASLLDPGQSETNLWLKGQKQVHAQLSRIE